MPKRSSVTISSRQLHFDKHRVSSPVIWDFGRVPSSHLLHALHYDGPCAQRHLLQLTTVAHGRAPGASRFRCVVMFVSGMECRSNHESPLARGSSTSILSSFRFPACRDPGRIPSSHLQCALQYNDHALNGTIYSLLAPNAMLDC